MTKRFMTKDGQPADVQMALQALAALVESDTSIAEIVLVVPSLKDFPRTTLGSELGEAASKKLAKGEAVTINNVAARVTSETKFVRPGPASLVVAVYADHRMMNRVDEAVGVHTVIAVPHIPGAIDAWKTARQPQVLGEPAASAPAGSPIKDSVVERALEDITSYVNLSTAGLGVRDRQYTEQILRCLRVLEHHAEPAANIRAWAISHNWRPGAADELEKIAKRVFALKKKPKLDADCERARERWLPGSEP